jgi:hypothetical protein
MVASQETADEVFSGFLIRDFAKKKVEVGMRKWALQISC